MAHDYKYIKGNVLSFAFLACLVWGLLHVLAVATFYNDANDSPTRTDFGMREIVDASDPAESMELDEPRCRHVLVSATRVLYHSSNSLHPVRIVRLYRGRETYCNAHDTHAFRIFVFFTATVLLYGL